MRRLLIDYTDILETTVDKSHNVGLITLKDLSYFNVIEKEKTTIKSRGKKFIQHSTVEEMLDSGETEDTYAFNNLNQIVFAVTVDNIKTFCDAKAYVTGLELIYPMRDVVYTTADDNATFDLKVKLSSTGEILHFGDNMSFSDIGNVMKILNNKLNLNSFGFDIFEINRSLDIKK